MRGAIALLSMLFALPAPAHADEGALVVYVVSPKGRASKTPISEFLRAAQSELTKRASIEAASLEQIGVDPEDLSNCPREERYACWTRNAKQAAYLLVLAVHPVSDTEDELLPIVLDVAEANRRLQQGPREADAIEEQISEHAVISKPATTVATASPPALDAYFAALFERELRPMLERAGRWGPRAKPKLVLPVTPPPPPPVSPAWTGTILGGAVLAAAGATITAVAMVKNADGLWYACAVRPGDPRDSCPKVQGASFGHDPGAAPATNYSAVNPSGLHILPLGLSLLAGGGTAALSTWLTAEESEVPYYQLGAGLLALGLVFGVTQVLDAP